MMRIIVGHMLDATYAFLYMYEDHILDDFRKVTGDFYAFKVEVDICKAESFVGVGVQRPTQSTKNTWKDLCKVIYEWQCIKRCRVQVSQSGRQCTFVDPYRAWWDCFVRNMKCIYAERPTETQIENFHNKMWCGMSYGWICFQFSCVAHENQRLASDPLIVRLCFSPYCHSLVRHWDLFLRKYRTMYIFMQRCVEAAHKQTRKDYKSLRCCGAAKATKHVLKIGELDRVLARLGHL